MCIIIVYFHNTGSTLNLFCETNPYSIFYREWILIANKNQIINLIKGIFHFWLAIAITSDLYSSLNRVDANPIAHVPNVVNKFCDFN